MSVRFGIHKQRFFFSQLLNAFTLKKDMVLGDKKILMMKNIVYKLIDVRVSFFFFPFLLYQQILTIPIIQIQPILVLQLTICPIQVLLQDMFLYLALIQKIHQKFEFNLLQLIRETLQAKPGKTKKKW